MLHVGRDARLPPKRGARADLAKLRLGARKRLHLSPLASGAAPPMTWPLFGLATAFGLRAALCLVATAAPAYGWRRQSDVTEALLFWAASSVLGSP